MRDERQEEKKSIRSNLRERVNKYVRFVGYTLKLFVGASIPAVGLTLLINIALWILPVVPNITEKMTNIEPIGYLTAFIAIWVSLAGIYHGFDPDSEEDS